jgi:glycosyltransferase involved in cell wall biosynthesis
VKLLLIVDDYVPHSSKVAAKMMHELAVEFVEKGNEVTVLTPLSTLKRGMELTTKDGVSIVYFKSGVIKNTSKIKRACNETLLSFRAWYYTRSYFKQIEIDGIISYSPSIFFGLLVIKLKRLWSCQSYLILRDVFPQWVVDNQLISKDSLIHHYFKFFERISYSSASKIGVMSEANLNYFQLNCSDSTKFEILYNWSKSTDIPHSNIKYRTQLNLVGKVVFFYGGNIGQAQQMSNLIELAKRLIQQKDVHFLFVGNGDEVEYLLSEKSKFNLHNISYIPSVSQDVYQCMLDEFDIGLFSLHNSHITHNFPGKLLGYMNSSIPILGCVNSGNDLKELVNSRNAGYIVSSGSHDDLEQKAFLLLKDSTLRNSLGANGKTLLESEFSIDIISNQILNHFKSWNLQ